jgi:hypothetical protein
LLQVQEKEASAQHHKGSAGATGHHLKNVDTASSNTFPLFKFNKIVSSTSTQSQSSLAGFADLTVNKENTSCGAASVEDNTSVNMSSEALDDDGTSLDSARAQHNQTLSENSRNSAQDRTSEWVSTRGRRRNMIKQNIAAAKEACSVM